MAEHTKLPWNVRDHQTPHGGRHIWIEGGEPIGQTRAGPYKRQILEDEDYNEKAADAALIVKAVNNHDALVKALAEIEQLSDNCINAEHYDAQAALEDLQAIRSAIKRCRVDVGQGKVP